MRFALPSRSTLIINNTIVAYLDFTLDLDYRQPSFAYLDSTLSSTLQSFNLNFFNPLHLISISINNGIFDRTSQGSSSNGEQAKQRMILRRQQEAKVSPTIGIAHQCSPSVYPLYPTPANSVTNILVIYRKSADERLPRPAVSQFKYFYSRSVRPFSSVRG